MKNFAASLNLKELPFSNKHHWKRLQAIGSIVENNTVMSCCSIMDTLLKIDTLRHLETVRGFYFLDSFISPFSKVTLWTEDDSNSIMNSISDKAQSYGWNAMPIGNCYACLNSKILEISATQQEFKAKSAAWKEIKAKQG